MEEVEGPQSLGRGSGTICSSCKRRTTFKYGINHPDYGDDEGGGDGVGDDDGEHGQACPVRAAVN